MPTTVNSAAIFSRLQQRLAEQPVVLATVTAAQRQAYIGRKLLIWGDAQIYGSLGSSAIDRAAIKLAFSVLKTGIGQRIILDGSNAGNGDFSPAPAAEPISLWLGLWQGSSAIATAQQIVTALESDRAAQLVIPLVTGQAPYVRAMHGETAGSLRNLQGQDAYIEELVN